MFIGMSNILKVNVILHFVFTAKVYLLNLLQLNLNFCLT